MLVTVGISWKDYRKLLNIKICIVYSALHIKQQQINVSNNIKHNYVHTFGIL